MNLLFVLLSAILYAVSFPKLSWWWFAFFGIAPLFVVLHHAGTFRKRIGFGFLWSLVMVSAMGYWLFYALVNQYGAAVSSAVIFIVLFVVFPVCTLVILFAGAFHLLDRHSFFFFAIVVPSLWIIHDFLKSKIPLLIPWGDIGYAVMPFSRFVQVADIGGVYGVSFLILLINGSIAWLVCRRRPAERREGGRTGAEALPRKLPAIAVILLALLLPSAYGHYRISGADTIVSRSTADKATEAVIVQGNHRSVDRWSGMGFSNRLKTYLEMSNVESASGQRVIVWPETVLNASNRLDDAFFVQVMKWIGSDTLLIAGGVFEDKDGSGDIFNSAYLISGRGRLLRYDKHILLPYAEAVPPIDLLGRYYTAPEHFSRGRTPSCLNAPTGAVGASICLEILYPGFIRRSVRDGAAFLVTLSNDAWFGRSAMPYLHLSAARMRAIENRRFLLRAANSGISALVGPDGRLIGNTELFERGVITGRFMQMENQTIYTRFGDWVVLAAAGIICFAAGRRLLGY